MFVVTPTSELTRATHHKTLGQKLVETDTSLWNISGLTKQVKSDKNTFNWVSSN